MVSITFTTIDDEHDDWDSTHANGCSEIVVITGGTVTVPMTLWDIASARTDLAFDRNTNALTNVGNNDIMYWIGHYLTGSINSWLYVSGNSSIRLYIKGTSDSSSLMNGDGSGKFGIGNRGQLTVEHGDLNVLVGNYSRGYYHTVPLALPSARVRCLNGGRYGVTKVQSGISRPLITTSNTSNTDSSYFVGNASMVNAGANISNSDFDLGVDVSVTIYGSNLPLRSNSLGGNFTIDRIFNTGNQFSLFSTNFPTNPKVITIRDIQFTPAIATWGDGSNSAHEFRIQWKDRSYDLTYNFVRYNGFWTNSLFKFSNDDANMTVNLRQDVTVTFVSPIGASISGDYRFRYTDITTTFNSTLGGAPTVATSEVNTGSTYNNMTSATRDVIIRRYSCNRDDGTSDAYHGTGDARITATTITKLAYDYRRWGDILRIDQNITIANQPTTSITLTSNTDESLTATSSSNVDETGDDLDDIYDTVYKYCYEEYIPLPFSIDNGVMIFNSNHLGITFHSGSGGSTSISGNNLTVTSSSTVVNGTKIRGMIIPNSNASFTNVVGGNTVAMNFSRGWANVSNSSNVVVGRNMRLQITTGSGTLYYKGTYQSVTTAGVNSTTTIAFANSSNGTIGMDLVRARINGTITIATHKSGHVDRVLHYNLGEFGVVETETYVAKFGSNLTSPFPTWDSVLTLEYTNLAQNRLTLTYEGASGTNDLPAPETNENTNGNDTNIVEIQPTDVPTLVEWINRQEPYLDSTLEHYGFTSGSSGEGQITVNENDDLVLAQCRLKLVIADALNRSVRFFGIIRYGTNGSLDVREKNDEGQQWDVIYGVEGSRQVNAQDVWNYRTRTLTTSSGTSPQAIWEYSTRTLTSGSNATITTINTNVQTLVSELTGQSNAPTITFTRGVASNGTTYGFAITGNVVQYGAIGDNSSGDRTISPFTVPIDTLTFTVNAGSTLDIVIDFNGNDAARSRLDKDATFRIAQGTNSLEFELRENHFDEVDSTFKISLTYSSTNHSWLEATGTGTLQIYFNVHDMTTATFESNQGIVSDINTIDTRTNTINTTLNSVDDKIDDISSSVHFPTLSTSITLNSEATFNNVIFKVYAPSNTNSSIGSQTIDGFFSSNITEIDTRIVSSQLRFRLTVASAITDTEQLNNTIRIVSGSNTQDFTYTTSNWNAGRTILTVLVASTNNNTFLSSGNNDVTGTISIPDRQIREILLEMEEDTDLIPGLNTRVTAARMTSIDNLNTRVTTARMTAIDNLNTRVTDTRMTNLDTMYNELVGIENAPTISYIRGYQSGTPNTYGFAITGTNVQYGGLGDNTEEQRTLSPFPSAIETLSFQEINNSTIRATIEFDDYTKAVSQLDKDAIFRITQGTNVLEFELNEGHAILANSLFRVDIPNNSTTEWIVTGTSNLTCNLQVYFSVHDMVTANFESKQEIVDDVNTIDTRTSTMNTNINTINTNTTAINTRTTTMNTNINTINTNVTTVDTVVDGIATTVDDILENVEQRTFSSTFSFPSRLIISPTLADPRRLEFSSTMGSLGSTTIDGFFDNAITTIWLFRTTATNLRMRIVFASAITHYDQQSDTIILRSGTNEQEFSYTESNWNSNNTILTINITYGSSNNFITAPLFDGVTDSNDNMTGTLVVERTGLRTLLEEENQNTSLIQTLSNRVTQQRMERLDTLYTELTGIESATQVTFTIGYQSGTPNTYGFSITGTNVQYGGLGDNTVSGRTLKPFKSPIDTLTFQEVTVNSTEMIRTVVDFNDVDAVSTELEKEIHFRVVQGTNVFEFSFTHSDYNLSNALYRFDNVKNSENEWIVTGTSSKTATLDVYFETGEIIKEIYDKVIDIEDEISTVEQRVSEIHSETVAFGEFNSTVTVRRVTGYTNATLVGFYVDSSNTTQGGMTPREIDLFNGTSYNGVEFTEFYTVTNNSQTVLYFNLTVHVPVEIIHAMDLRATISGTEYTIDLSGTTNLEAITPLEYRTVIPSATYTALRSVSNNGTFTMRILVGSVFHNLLQTGGSASGSSESSLGGLPF